MLIFLTLSFYLSACLGACAYFYSLFFGPPAADRANRAPRFQDTFSTGCGVSVALILSLLLTVPNTYLAAVALDSLGLPAWWAWLTFWLSWVLMAAAFVRHQGEVPTGYVSPNLLSIGLAWYGLEVLARGAA